jgi:hypothetical protein
MLLIAVDVKVAIDTTVIVPVAFKELQPVPVSGIV